MNYLKYSVFGLLCVFSCDQNQNPTLQVSPKTEQTTKVSDTKDMPEVARIGSEEIAPWEIDFALSQQLPALLSQGATQEQINESMPQIRSAIVQEFLSLTVFAKEAENRGIKALPEDIESTYKNMNPALQTQDIPKEEVERVIRRHILADKVKKAIVEEVVVTDEEIEKTYREALTKLKISYVHLPFSRVRKNLPSNEEEINTYRSAHQKEIEDYYKKHTEEFQVPESVKVRHILIKVGPKASTSDEKASQDKIEKLAKEIAGGASFEEIAKKHSEDSSSANAGGELGWVNRGQSVPPFEKAAFALEEGKVSEVVRSSFGFHLIKVESKRKASSKSLQEASTKIAEKLLLTEKAKSMAKESIDAVLSKAKQGMSLEKAVAATQTPDAVKLEAKETKFFTLAQAVPGLGRSQNLLDAVHSLRKEKPLHPEVLQLGDSYTLISLQNRQDADMSIFTSQKDRIRTEVIRARKNKVLQEFLQKNYRELELKDSIQVNPEFIKKPRK